MSGGTLSLVFLMLMIIASSSSLLHAEDISINKVHLVDQTFKNAALFRGNAPLTVDPSDSKKTIFAYDTLLKFLRQRAKEASLDMPLNNSDVYLLDITFENIFDKHYDTEAEFWKDTAKNSAKGHYEAWLLAGAPLWATDFSKSEQDKKIRDGSIWDIDQIPARLDKMRTYLRAGPPAGYKFLAVYVHCAGGCDRTGEFITNYRMQYQHTPLLTTIYATDISECGRAPNYFSTGAIGWYCLQWNLFNSTSGNGTNAAVPDCLTAYKCDLFGKCQPTGV